MIANQQKQLYVTFAKINKARTGNILFQYLFAASIHLQYGHTYIAIEDFQSKIVPSSSTPIMKITDKNYAEYTESIINASHIICEGFFQHDKYYLPLRTRLINYLKSSNDSWIGVNGKREYIREFFESTHSVDLRPHDIVMSLRLDDFLQLSNKTSDIIPPKFYQDILEKWFSTENREDGRLIIVCDKIQRNWEYKYLEFFHKWSPILIQNTLQHDCALMRNCSSFIHSNSTLSWIMSFLSEKKHRFIPVTGTYASQHLESIDPNDSVFYVQPMTHKHVTSINVMCYHRDIKTLPYCIPDEIFVDTPIPVANRKHVIAPLIPGSPANYLFGAGQESEYYDLYRQSMFAITMKKGGWDCLRHYEILANGCIPAFEDLDKCPEDTMTSFPKKTLTDALGALIPWRNEEEQKVAYDFYCAKLLEETRQRCSVSATISRFFADLRSIPDSKSEEYEYSPERLGRVGRIDIPLTFENKSFVGAPIKILMLTCHPAINYTRELTWIGIKRAIMNIPGSEAVEWPPIDSIYDSFPKEKLSQIYGNGFTYSRRLPAETRKEMSDQEVIESIKRKHWDLIIYGKVGCDESKNGGVPNLPCWDHVFKRYSRDQIVFFYGGDGMQDMNWSNNYSNHLVRHSQYARCFVRELIRWNDALT